MLTNTLSYTPLFRRRLLLRGWSTIVLGILLFIAVSVGCLADVGARPLAMGGAFVGLADDANATYYNPAGLANLDSPQMTLADAAENRYAFASKSYLAYASRLPGKHIGYGISYISGRMSGLSGVGVDSLNWYWLSGAYKVGNSSFGMNLRVLDNAFQHKSAGIDLSFLSVMDDKWSVGLLVQDINRPSLGISDLITTAGDYSHNLPTIVRPGIAYHFDRNTVVAMDLYDMFGKSGSHSTRLGAEKVLKNGLALRAGYYALGGFNCLTLGAGGKIGKMQFDGAIMSCPADDVIMLGTTGKF